jgi:hypothetical protein
MKELVNKTVELINLWNKRFPKAVVFWSGGKDSTAMLHLLKYKACLDLPIVQFREPKFRERYEYSDMLIKKWDLNVYDYPALKMALADGPDVETGEVRFDLLKYFQWGSKCMVMSLGTERPKGDEKFLCAVDDFLQRPTGTFNFIWESVYIGTKNTDTDLIKGRVAVTTHIRYAEGSPISLYPLRDWTDEDVYQYLEEEGVPLDPTRYLKVSGKWQNNPDKSMNADFIPTCLNCVDRHAGKYVYCPKLKSQISNISAYAPYEDIVIEDLGFKPVDWNKNKSICSTANPVEPVAATNGRGQSSRETKPMQREYRTTGFAKTIR